MRRIDIFSNSTLDAMKLNLSCLLITVKSAIRFAGRLAGLARHHNLRQVINFARVEVGTRRLKSYLRYSPTFISINVTDRCNLKCDFCMAHSKATPKNYEYYHVPSPDMTFEMFKDIVDRFRIARAVSLIGSGEPLLNSDLLRMVEYAAVTYRMEVYTVSNGILVENFADRIAQSSLSCIDISMNGHTPEEFAKMTRMPSHLFRKIVSG